MFRRCVYYFMIGMFGLAYVFLVEGVSGMNGPVMDVLAVGGLMIFFLMSFVFLVELIAGFIREWKKPTVKSNAVVDE